MNYSTSFIQPTKLTKPETTPSLGASAKSNAPSTPFDNVLDRAVKPSIKPKNDSLTAGRSEEHRSERSVEAHEDHKPSAPPRGSKRKNEDDRQDAPPIVSVGLPPPPALQTVVAPPDTAPEVTESLVGVSGETQAAQIEGCAATSSSGQNSAAPVNDASTLGEVVASTSKKEISADINQLKPVSAAEVVDFQEVADASKGMMPEKDSASDSSSPIASSVNNGAIEVIGMTADKMLKASPTDATAAFKAPDGLVDVESKAVSAERPMIQVSNAREVAPRASAQKSGSESDKASSDEVLEPVVVAQAANTEEVAPPEARRAVRAARRAAEAVAENPRGTGVAKMDMTMNKTPKQEEIAGLSGQILPSAPIGKVSAMKNLPSEIQRRVTGDVSSLDALNLAARSPGGPARSSSSEVNEVRNADAASPAVRIGEVISREVRMFKRGGDDLVEVVLTPDSKTQISLKLQWRDGQVEVQARCDMGNYQSLNSHWPGLQSALATHGVRLSHLAERVHTGFTEFFNNSGFSQQRDNGQQSTPQPTAPDITLPAVMQPVKPAAAKPVARPNGRLESWA